MEVVKEIGEKLVILLNLEIVLRSMKWLILVKVVVRLSRVNFKKKSFNLLIIRLLLIFKIVVLIECNRVGGWKLDCKGLGSELMLRKEVVSIDYICEKFDLWKEGEK